MPISPEHPGESLEPGPPRPPRRRGGSVWGVPRPSGCGMPPYGWVRSSAEIASFQTWGTDRPGMHAGAVLRTRVVRPSGTVGGYLSAPTVEVLARDNLTPRCPSPPYRHRGRWLSSDRDRPGARCRGGSVGRKVRYLRRRLYLGMSNASPERPGPWDRPGADVGQDPAGSSGRPSDTLADGVPELLQDIPRTRLRGAPGTPPTSCPPRGPRRARPRTTAGTCRAATRCPR